MRFEMLDPQTLTFLVHDFLSPEECEAYIKTAESAGFTPAPLTTPRGPVIRPEVRDNERVMIDDHALAAQLWTRVRPVVPRFAQDWEEKECLAIGINERFRYYRYQKRQRFARHYDGPFIRTTTEGSILSFVVYLNEDFKGGETRFYTDSTRLRFKVKPRTGSALVFVHNQMHEGTRVTRGCKYVMRTDVMYRRYSKTRTEALQNLR